MARVVDIRPGERRPTFAAFIVLLGITAGHVLLEIGRDALFLARLPAQRLPFAYLAGALAVLLVTAITRSRSADPVRAVTRSLAGATGRGICIALLVSAAITLGFWRAALAWGADGASVTHLYALYLWTALFSSWVVVQLWMVLGERFTTVQAQRLYPLIAGGAVLGALLGAGAARIISELLPARDLLLAAAISFALTALGPALAFAPSGEGHEGHEGHSAPVRFAALGEDLRLSYRHPYLRRLLLLALLAAMAATLVDYVFKSELAREVATDELAPWLASIALLSNAVAWLVQLLAAGFVLRTFGVHRALRVLPLLLLVGAGGLLVSGGFLAALLLRTADGGVRHSLHRTSTELLFVPLSEDLRARLKPFIDLVGQRAGQVCAALIVLSIVALGGGTRAAAGAVMLLGALLFVLAAGLREQHLDLFRDSLRAGRGQGSGALPELDLSVLETLFAALNSPRNPEVIGALDILAAQKRERLIPALILYHPSAPVVLRALEIFARQGRTDFVPITERLLAHPSVTVRAAALRARAAVDPDEAYLRLHAADECLEVRATAVVSLLSRGLAGEDGAAALDALARDPSPAVRAALAKAIAAEPAPGLDPFLDALLQAPEPEVRLEAAWAAGQTKRERFLPRLLPLLAEQLAGAAARDAIAELGPPALAQLARSMDDPALPDELRWALPRAIANFPPAAAAPLLMARLEGQPDGTLRYRILRALGTLRALDPALPLDEAPLLRLTQDTLRRAIELLGHLVVLDRAHAARATLGGELLGTLIRDKEAHAVGRVFKLLKLLHPNESVERIERGLAGKDAKLKATSRALLESILAPALRALLLALLEDVPAAERLAALGAGHRPQPIERDALIRQLASRDDELGMLARYHAMETSLALEEGSVPEVLPSALGLQLSARRAGRVASDVA